VLNVGLHFATAIRLPETVSSVVVGDPARFKVEHSEKEPRLVFVKPISAGAAQSNLLISTVAGRNVSLLVRSEDSQTAYAANVQLLPTG
jgi:type IV secretory pathway VirB9-like protein